MPLESTQIVDGTLLAKSEAREVQEAYPALFREMPVPVSDVASLLGVKVERRSELQQRAQLEVFVEQREGFGTIVLAEDLDPNVSRFAIAHEIGHAILLWRHPDKAKLWNLKAREDFANAFAAELLIPLNLRVHLATEFRQLTDPLALVRFASRLGLSPRALLTSASREPVWLRNLDRVWLRVKYTNNAFTGTQPKLRIVSAHYDRHRFFVATNQSLSRFAGNDEWLESLPYGVLVRHNCKISISLRQPQGAVPKFLSPHPDAELTAVRLRPSAAETGAYIIILAQMAHSTTS